MVLENFWANIRFENVLNQVNGVRPVYWIRVFFKPKQQNNSYFQFARNLQL